MLQQEETTLIQKTGVNELELLWQLPTDYRLLSNQGCNDHNDHNDRKNRIPSISRISSKYIGLPTESLLYILVS
jgi:hypothetical protein